MIILAFSIAVLFALLAGFLGLLAWRSRNRELAFGLKVSSLLGLDSAKTTISPQAWDNAHYAAVPYWATAAGICLIQAIACGLSATSPDLLGSGYLWILLVLGLLLVSLLLVLASKAGNRAAK